MPAEDPKGDLNVVMEIPSEGEPEPRKTKKRSKWTVIDVVIAWLPAVAAAYGIVKWITEIVRCFSGGAYAAQFTNCTRLFSIEFLPRYYEPVLFWIAGVKLGIGLLYAIVRFYRLAKTGKRVAFTVLFLLTLLIAAPIALIWGLHDHSDAPLMQALIRTVGEERLSAFFHANQWIYRSAFPYVMLGAAALFLFISLRLLYFDERCENRRFFSFIVTWAAVIFLGIPLLILLSQNGVLAVVIALAILIVGILFFYFTNQMHSITAIDFKQNTIHIRRAYIYNSLTQKNEIGELKTKNSKRVLPLPEMLKAELLKLKERDKQICEYLGIEIPYLCINDAGQLLTPNICSHHFQQAAKKVGLKGMRLHDLRHTVVTYMLDVGENPKTVQEFVGHADPGFMLRQYAHVLEQSKKRASDTLMRTLFGQNV